MEESNKNLWEEKNSTEPKKNCENNQIPDPKDIIKETNLRLIENQWKDIGKISGIYKIINKVNGKYYVGSSKNIIKRLKEHRTRLNNKNHQNIHLQRAWHKYGHSAFIFNIVKGCLISDLQREEQLYLNECKLNRKNAYNISYDATAPNRGMKLSKNHRQKISESHKGKIFSLETIEKMRGAKLNKYTGVNNSNYNNHKLKGINNPNYGKVTSDLIKQKMSLALRKSDLYQWYHAENNILEKLTIYDFRHKYNIHPGNLSHLIHKTNNTKSVKGWTILDKQH